MNWRLLVTAGRYWAAYGLERVEEKVKAWTKPTTERQIVGIGSDLMRSKSELVAENAYLRQQVIVLRRQNKGKPQLTQHDRRVLVLLASRLKGWQEALHIVAPDTLLKWHRQGFRLYWRRKTRTKGREPRLEAETIALIKEMAVANRLWGAPRIGDEWGSRSASGQCRSIGDKRAEDFLHKTRFRHGAAFWPIMRMRYGRVILCRPMTCFSEWFSSFSSSSWGAGEWCISA